MATSASKIVETLTVLGTNYATDFDGQRTRADVEYAVARLLPDCGALVLAVFDVIRAEVTR